jgi:hypothetical protein
LGKIIKVDFVLSRKPITPDLNKTHNYFTIGGFIHFVQLTPNATKSYIVQGLTASCPPGTYYLGTTVDCGPISSPGNPTMITILPIIRIPGFKTTADSTLSNQLTVTLSDSSSEADNYLLPDSSDKLDSLSDEGDFSVNEDTAKIAMVGKNKNLRLLHDSTHTAAPDDLKIYPNPTQGQLNVKFNCKTVTNYRISFFDANGRLVMTKEGKTNSGVNLVKLDISNFSKGVYLIDILADQVNKKTKIIVL